MLPPMAVVLRHRAIAGIVATVLGLGAFSGFAAGPAIIPKPVTLQSRPGFFTLCPTQQVAGALALARTPILVDAASIPNGQFLAATFAKSTGYQFDVVTNSGTVPVRGAILLTTASAVGSLGAEGYELTVAPDSVLIRAPAQAGIFYGIQSLLQLFPPQILSQQAVGGVPWTAPCVYVQDQPRFAWRGTMLDVSRHFVDKDEVKKILDALALHKLNTFHWHLTDDHGWRMEIKSYPSLTVPAATNTGAWRTGIDYAQNPQVSTAWNSFGKYGGYYTQEELKEVVAYAQQRYITVVPEIEFPAHCTAALVSYASLGCGNAASAYNMDNINYSFTLFSLAGPGSWTFFTNVLTEVMNIFPSKYIHTGGDEVIATGDTQWLSYAPDANQIAALGLTGTSTQKRQAYQRWFSTNLVAFLKQNGRTMVGWTEFEAAGTIPGAVLMEWQKPPLYASQTASNGQPVVMAPNGINYYQQQDAYTKTNEPFFQVGSSPAYLTMSGVYNYEPVPSNLNAPWTTNIIGSQLNLWTEFVPSALNVEYKMFPRLCAQSEVTWTPAASKNYSDFTTRLATDMQRLAAMGMNYNKETNVLVGTWGPSVPTSPTTVTYDLTPYVTKSGEIDVSFVYTSGSDGINVYSVTLLENGVQVDSNVFTGFAGLANYTQTGSSFGGVAYYALKLPWFHAGATYTIQVSMAEHGSNNSTTGKVFLPNWN